MEGESIHPLVTGERDPADWKDDVFIQISEAETGRALRTDRWKYSVYAPEADAWEDPEAERYVERYLYDLRADPHEQENLIGRGDYRDVADRLRERLEARIGAVEDSDVEIEPAEYHA